MHLGNRSIGTRSSAEGSGAPDAMLSALKLEDTQPLRRSVPCHFNHASDPKRKFYLVTVGRQIGIFDDWNWAQKSYQNYSSGACKRYDTFQAAKEAWDSQDIDPASIEEPLVEEPIRAAGNIRSVDMTTRSTLGPNVAPRSVPGPSVAPRSVPGPNVAPRSAPGPVATPHSTLKPVAASTNPDMVTGPSTLGSGYHVAEGYWVVTHGERPGVYFGYDVAVQRGIGSATTGLHAMQRFSTRHEANEVFVMEFMLQNVIATSY